MTSRLIVKNIPQNYSESSLKQLFSKFGDVTDARVQFKGDKNRRFAFVGFKNENDAKKAQQYFNNTYIQLSKISVDFARSKDDPLMPKNQKLQQKIKQKEEKLTKQQSQDKSGQDDLKEDKKAKFKEFLELMKGGGSKATMSWSDNVINTEEEVKNSKKKIKKNEQQQVTEIFEKSRTEEVKTILKKNSQPTQQGENSQLDEKRLYVLNLPFNATQEEVKSLFMKYGQVESIKMPKGKDGQFKGFAYVSFSNAEEAIRAFAELDNTIVLGRILHIRPAYQEKLEEWQLKQQNNQQGEDFKEKSSFKRLKKDSMRKKLDDQSNWNTLFMNPNSVLAVISQRFNIQKSDIFGLDSADQAVKLSLAETQIVNETKEWLQQQGVNMEFLESDRKNCNRSNTIILIKNIPFTTSEKGLTDLFSHYGALSRFLVCPCKSIAIAQYESDTHAKNAFKNLSYYEYKFEPLYLEWAPDGFFSTKEDTKAREIVAEQIQEEEQESASANDKILFVKNLNFDTKEEDLKKLFQEQIQGVKSAKIVTKNNLSCGYGFIEFSEESKVQQSLKKLQNHILDGHSLQLSVSKKTIEVKKPKKTKNVSKEKPSTKIIIRNIAFEATKDDIKNLFKNFGEVKTIRLPKKMDNNHRGFAFVEFVTIEEAKNAFESLQYTHLYGRKLNLEWAKNDRSADELVVLN